MLGFKDHDKENAKEQRDEDNQGFLGMDAGYIGQPFPKITKLHESEISEGECPLEEDIDFDPEKNAKFTEKYTGLRTAKQEKLENVYGKQDKKLSNKELSDNAVDVANNFHKLEPAEQRIAVAGAKARRKAAGLGGKHLHGNTKNETANDVVIGGKKNHTYGISGSPAVYPHILGDGSISNQVTCNHATASCGGTGAKKGIGGSCLAQKAQGQQDTNRVSRDHYSQAERHSLESHGDHVLTLMHEIKLAHAKAGRDNRNLLLRGDNYTNDHDEKYNELHNTLNKKIAQDAGVKYTRYGYTKNPQDKNDPKSGNFKVWSNSGPFVKKNPDTGTSEFVNPLKNRDEHMTEQTTESDSNPHPMNQYVVANIRRPNSKSKKTHDKVYTNHEDFMNNTKKFRSWKIGKDIPEGHKEEGVSEKDSTKEEFHHPNGWGWTTKSRKDSDGSTKRRRYHYQDYDAITPAHDNRAADEEQNAGTTKTRSGKRVGLAIVSSAVSSTPKHDLSHSTMFHDTNRLDHATGILHANHPDEQEEAFAHEKATGRPAHVGKEVPSTANVKKLGMKD